MKEVKRRVILLAGIALGFILFQFNADVESDTPQVSQKTTGVTLDDVWNQYSGTATKRDPNGKTLDELWEESKRGE